MKKFIRHLFIPHHRNNHRAKILHNSTLALVAAALFFGTILGVQLKSQNPKVLGISYSIGINDLFFLTNKARVENGLPVLQLSPELSSAAQKKADDMFAKNYWAHFAPGENNTPWVFIRNSGYDYLYAGENLAKGYTDSKSVVDAWMASKMGHRENILGKNYKDIGFAVKEGKINGEDTVLVVQMLGARSTSVAEVSDTTTSTGVNTANAESKIIPDTITPFPNTVKRAVIKSVQQPKIAFAPQVNIQVATKTILIVVLGIFFMVFALDLIIIERKKIPRVVGHNLDHIMLILLFLLFIILQNSGGIL